MASPSLSRAIVAAEGATPSRHILFLHGILGSGGNWRTFARRLVAARPSWSAVLVDLRMHGQSQGFGPPHTLAACADDLRRLEAELALPVAAVLGHSFGGKVALEYASRRPDLELAWILDSSPGARPDARGSESTVRIVQLLETLPEHFPTRESFIDYIVKSGTDRPIAMWLAMNLRTAPDGNGYALRVELPALRALLDDYFARDEWPVIERESKTRFHIVVGGRSTVLDEAERRRAEQLASESERVRLHVIEGAGHWIHVDAPDALFDLVAAAMP